MTPDIDPILPARLELAPGAYLPPAVLRVQTARSGGPGGQNVNKVNTKIELWVPVEQILGLTVRARMRLRTLAGKRLTQADEIHIAAESQRSQEQNRQEALQRLRELLIEAMHEPKPRRKTKPTRASRQRRLDTKRLRGQIKAKRRGGDE